MKKEDNAGMDEKFMFFLLAYMEAGTFANLNKVVQNFGKISDFFSIEPETLVKRGIISTYQYSCIKKVMDREDELKNIFNNLKGDNINFVTFNDAEFPEKLRMIPNPPLSLFFKGHLPESFMPAVAIIGSRNCDEYGSEMAKYFSDSLSEAGIQIISGMAMGIDGISGEAAIGKRGKSYAVLGTGVDICYPEANFNLYEKLISSGGVISEYPPGTPGLKSHFPMRNRIISGLSDALLVIQAKIRSGTSITVDCALEQGKDVYAIPGRLSDDLSAGTNKMLQDGARLVREPMDIIEGVMEYYSQLSIDFKKEGKRLMSENIKEKILEGLSDGKKKILKCLDEENPVYIDEILEKTGIEYGSMVKMIFELETQQLIFEKGNNYFVKSFIKPCK
jgi:DNA processing protein